MTVEEILNDALKGKKVLTETMKQPGVVTGVRLFNYDFDPNDLMLVIDGYRTVYMELDDEFEIITE
jgi:hypothetical protein